MAAEGEERGRSEEKNKTMLSNDQPISAEKRDGREGGGDGVERAGAANEGREVAAAGWVDEEIGKGG